MTVKASSPNLFQILGLHGDVARALISKSMVVIDKEDYNTKSEELLQSSTYKILTTGPTNRHKNKLISLLKSIKAEGGISETTYKKLHIKIEM